MSRRLLVGGAGLAALVAVAVASGGFASFRVAQFCIFCLLFLSLVVLTGQAGVISLLAAAYLGVGAFAAATLVARAEVPFLLAVVGAGLVTAVASVIIGLPVLRLPASAFIVMTLGFAALIDEVVFTNEFCCAGGTRGVPIARPSFATGDAAYLVLCAVVLALAYAFTAAWRDGRVGRALAATRDNARAAEVLGVNVVKARLTAFAVSGFLAGLAGGLFAGLLQQVSSQSGVFGNDRGIEFFGLAMLGGIGSLAGPVIAASIRVLLGVVLDDWEHLGLLLLFLAGPGTVLVYLRAPDGLAGLAGRLLSRRERRADHRPPVVSPGPPGEWAGGARLRVRQVTCDFGGLRALDRVDFTVEPGQIVALLGTNGAGKSTLINAVSGLVPVTAGRIALDDPARPGSVVDLLDLQPYQRVAAGVGRSFQDVRLFPTMTVTDNLLVATHARADHGLLASGLRLPAATRGERRARADVAAVLELVDLTPYAEARADELSFGTLRLVELAAMLVLRPRLLLLDEPASGVAEAEALALRPLLRRLRDETGVSMVLVEHDVGLVTEVADRVVGMDAGRVLVEGPPGAVLADPDMIAAYLGSEPVAAR